jgi:type III secretion protein C
MRATGAAIAMWRTVRSASVHPLHVACFTVCIVASSAAPCAESAIRWHDATVHIAVEGKDVKDVLRDFTSSQGVPTTISGDVHGTVTGRFNMPPQPFLDTLASTFGFVWFYDGNVLSISDASNVTRQVIQLNHATPADLKAMLERLRIVNPDFPITYDGEHNTALVNGPQQYVQLVTDVARRLDASVAQRAGSEVRIFPLHSAWAADHKVEIDGEQYVVQGVAGVLSALYHPGGNGGQAGAASPSMQPGLKRVGPMANAAGDMPAGVPPVPAVTQDSTMPSGLGGLLGGTAAAKGKGAAGVPGLPGTGTTDDGYAGLSDGADGGSPNGLEALPVIEADSRTNSVLIRDLPQRLSQYQTLIEQLDVKPKLVEIEAHIIEIDDNALKQIGVDWRAHNSHVDLQTGNGISGHNGYNGNIDPTFGSTTLADGTTIISTSPLGASLTAVLGNAGRYLLARVDALQQSNLARIDASPKVATLDNGEAVMDHKTRFFVRVSGYTSADLYSVSAGVSLRVRPLIVNQDDSTQIKLAVHIEDGQLTGQEVDNIPVVTTSTINTEAFVGQGESLLIAGYRTDTATNLETGVPGLSKIPIIGALFRYRSNERSHMERIFLISPRIIQF